MTFQDNTAEHPARLDAELLRLERQYEDARAACAPGCVHIDERIAERYRIAEAIEQEPARTPAGHVAKLQIWIDMLAVAHDGDSPVPLDGMAFSIAAIRAAVAAGNVEGIADSVSGGQDWRSSSCRRT